MVVVGLEYGEAFNDGPSLSTFAKRTIITNSSQVDHMKTRASKLQV